MFKSKTFMNVRDEADPDGNAPHDDFNICPLDPLPDDFLHFIPWACLGLATSFEVVVKKIQQDSVHTKLKGAKHKVKANDSHSTISHQYSKHVIYEYDESAVRLTATFDSSNNLIRLKFDKSSDKPQALLKLIRMVAHYYPHLATIIFEPPIESYIPYEVSKIVHVANIREVFFDGCFLSDGSYYVLLEGECHLKKLSLSRCNITDNVLSMICSNLVYPSPASKSLSILILASNEITDIGVKHLADVLRSNRQLACLNLSDNAITDIGAEDIFDILNEFRVNEKELYDYHARHQEFLKCEEALVEKFIDEYKDYEVEPKLSRKKTKFPGSNKSKGPQYSESVNKNVSNDKLFQDYAKAVIQQKNGEFLDPFSDIIAINKVAYSPGNNTLQMLNLAYNNLTYLSLKNILNVLLYQKLLDRKPRGLVHLCLDGNRIPVHCKELIEIENLLGLESPAKPIKKKSKSSSTSK